MSTYLPAEQASRSSPRTSRSPRPSSPRSAVLATSTPAGAAAQQPATAAAALAVTLARGTTRGRLYACAHVCGAVLLVWIVFGKLIRVV